MIWRRYGFYFTHKAAVKIEMIEALQSLINQGISSSGFHLCHLEDLKRYHLQSSVMCRSYVDSLRDTLVRSGSLRFTRQDVETKWCKTFMHLTLISTISQFQALLRTILYTALCPWDGVWQWVQDEMDTNDWWQAFVWQSQFKLAKCVVPNGTKTFTAMYCIMNKSRV